MKRVCKYKDTDARRGGNSVGEWFHWFPHEEEGKWAECVAVLRMFSLTWPGAPSRDRELPHVTGSSLTWSGSSLTWSGSSLTWSGSSLTWPGAPSRDRELPHVIRELPHVIRELLHLIGSSLTSAVVHRLQCGRSLITFFWGPRWWKWPKKTIFFFLCFQMIKRDKISDWDIYELWALPPGGLTFSFFRFKILLMLRGLGVGWRGIRLVNSTVVGCIVLLVKLVGLMLSDLI